MSNVDLDDCSVKLPPAGVVESVAGVSLIRKADKAKPLGAPQFLVPHQLQAEGRAGRQGSREDGVRGSGLAAGGGRIGGRRNWQRQ